MVGLASGVDAAGLALIPDMPETVSLAIGTHTNAQGLRLRSYVFRSHLQQPRAVALMLHGYAVHTIFEWLPAAEPAGRHGYWSESVLQRLVDAGVVVHALDHAGHGYSEGVPGSVENFADIPMDNETYLHEVALKDPQVVGLPVFLFGQSMGGAVAIEMAKRAPNAYNGMVLYAPMVCFPGLPTTYEGLVNVFATAQWPQYFADERARDELTFKGTLTEKTVEELLKPTQVFLSGGLASLQVPFLTIHADADPITDASGSQLLFEKAACSDKTYLRIGHDLQSENHHAISGMRGHDLVSATALRWLLERIPLRSMV